MRASSNIRLYFHYISIVLRSAMQYKISFVLMVIARFIVNFSSFLGIYFLFSTFTGIKQYTYADVVLNFSFVLMSFSIAECAASGFSTFSGLVKTGQFDRFLLRPRSLILQILGSKFEIGRAGMLLTGVILLIIGINKGNVNWTPLRVMTAVLMIAGGALLFTCLFWIGATICFFTIQETRYMNIFTYGGKEHGKYPYDVYGKGVLGICTYLIPYTLVQYYPLQYLLGATENKIYAFFPLGILLFFAACYGFWRFGLKNYKSSGS